MGGKSHGGKRIRRETALRIYSEIVDRMPTVESVKLCGSARRLKPTCGDLDIVVVPAGDPQLKTSLDDFFVHMFGYQKSGKPAKNGLFRGVQTEFYVASPSNSNLPLVLIELALPHTCCWSCIQWDFNAPDACICTTHWWRLVHSACCSCARS